MAIKVLLVIDGVFLFKTNGSVPDFTFNTLVGILTGAGFQVTKANREADPDADIQDFNFATSATLASRSRTVNVAPVGLAIG